MTPWWHYVVALPTALFLVNGIPHFVAGISGRRFPTAFVGGPPNLDTAQRNVLWGGLNFVIGGLLLWLLGDSLSNPILVIEMVAIALLAAWALAGLFSKEA